MRFGELVRIGAIGWLLGAACGACAADWPTYRADAGRSGYSPEPLPARLELRWVHRGRAPCPAWPTSARITFDCVHHPILAGDTVVVGSTADDSVVALDTGTGARRWRFFAGGPVRFAPAAWRDRVFVASDDGWLYALSLDDGSLLWKHRGGPNGRMCLGNGRMISRWPARGGPVVLDDTVYYAAGIWPSDGIYLHALRAATGEVLWTNDRTGRLEMPQPHGGANALSGVPPQGYLAATEERLFVPTGRAVPAAFQRADGELEYYRLQQNGSMGGARALVADRFVVNAGCFLDRETGNLAARAGRGVFSATPEGVVRFTGSTLSASRWADVETHDRKGKPVRYRGLEQYADVKLGDDTEPIRRAKRALESLPALAGLFRTGVVFKDADAEVARQTGLERTLAQTRPDVERLGADAGTFMTTAYERTHEVIAAGREAVCGSPGSVAVVDLDAQQVRWSHEVEGDAAGLAAASGVLLVATTRGALYCFAEPSPATQPQEEREETLAAAATPESPTAAGPTAHVDFARAAEEILAKSGVSQGVCLDLGCGAGQLATELVRRSRLHVIGIDADPAQVARARRTLADAGLYGDRVTIHHGNPADSGYPRYVANLIVSSQQLADPSATVERAEVRRMQRPCGGVVCLGPLGKLKIERRGPLEGAGQWTHQNSDAANTLCSADELVRGPLEACWYRDGVLEIPDRHAQGPAPLFNRGVLVVEGVHGVCALDAYNGTTRWVYPIPDVLADWDGVHHDVGVGDTGSNFCLSDDAVFVRTGPRCLKIDLNTGRKLAEFQTPVDAASANRDWGYVAHADGVLYGSVLNREHTVSPRYGDVRLRTESVLFFALDADTGEVKWRYQPEHSIRSNAIAIADGRVYLIDRVLALADRITEPKPNGKHRPTLTPGEHPGGTLIAFDGRSGSVVWKTSDDVFGTQLAVSSEHNVLLMYYQAVKHGFFKLPSEIGGRMAGFDANTGKRRWDRAAEYKTRPLVNGDVIYAEGGAWKLTTGEPVPWKFERSYGCGQIAGSRHLMLFRSATLGYLDLARDVGTENFGGMRTSCWFNAIPAGGLVLVPDGSSKCACSYQMQAWLALQPTE